MLHRVAGLQLQEAGQVSELAVLLQDTERLVLAAQAHHAYQVRIPQARHPATLPQELLPEKYIQDSYEGVDYKKIICRVL